MVKDRQVRKLMKLNQQEGKLSCAATKAGMCENASRKYLRLERLPNQCKPERTWRTREDPFVKIWAQASSMLEVNPGLEAKTHRISISFLVKLIGCLCISTSYSGRLITRPGCWTISLFCSSDMSSLRRTARMRAMTSPGLNGFTI